MNSNLTRSIIVTGAMVLATSAAQAAPIIAASLYSPQVVTGSSVSVAINNPGPAAASQTVLVGTGYAITFATDADEGVVQGTLSGRHAVAAAGIASGMETYLTGDYGSAQTTSLAASGKYLSTGVGSITIAFTTAETAFSLLWGSIDVGNDLKFYLGGALQADVTGAQVQAATSGFVSNGYQGPGGSAYVTINNLGFDSVVASSNTPSFEFTGAIASVAPIAVVVPEPGWVAGFGLSLLAVGALRGQWVQFSARPKRKLSA